jgi:hypothetical protein
MPSGGEHIAYCQDKLGISGIDIHEWMDEPSQQHHKGRHRILRHTPDTEVPERFIKKYGEELTKKIILNHIKLDNMTPKELSKYYEKRAIKTRKEREEFFKSYRGTTLLR